MKMTNEEAIQELMDAMHREADYGDKVNHYYDIMKRIEAFDIAIKALQQQQNNFNEVVDFFNDIMNTFHKELSLYDVSNESVRYARNVVYDVFSRRYRIKEIENGKSETIQEV